MSLENLAKIGKLKQHSATPEDAAKLVACIRSAEALLSTLIDWLEQNRKDWAP